MQLTVIERLEKIKKEFCEDKQSIFSVKIGVAERNINNYFSGKSTAPFYLFEKIKEIFPKINSDWLLLGQGEMILGEGKNQTIYNKNENPSYSPEFFLNLNGSQVANSRVEESEIAYNKTDSAELMRRVKELEEKVIFLQGENKGLKEALQLLKK